ncbi:MAG: VPLPA-CTERM sorting domain-containing protein, partial [Pseudomonadales bacterium]
NSYSQDFEGLLITDGAALSGDGWLVGANVFDPTGTNFLYNYFAFPAPNPGGGFSAIDSGQGGVPQGTQQLSVYSDYNNSTAHTNGEIIESIVFKESLIGAGDIGSTWDFSFDTKQGNIASPSTAIAFIKTLDQNTFGLKQFITVDTTTNANWVSELLSIAVGTGGEVAGDIFQIGFSNRATSFASSGVFYDNINLAAAAPAVPVPAAAWLFGSALAGLVVARRKK